MHCMSKNCWKHMTYQVSAKEEKLQAEEAPTEVSEKALVTYAIAI